MLTDRHLSSLELITARLLRGEVSEAIQGAALDSASRQSIDLKRLLQLLHQVNVVRRPDGRLSCDADPIDVFDVIVRLVLSLGAVAEADRMVSQALARWPHDPFLHGVLGLIRRAQGRLAEARELSAAAAVAATDRLAQPSSQESIVRRCELLLDWDAQMRALHGDLSAIGQFARFRESIARKYLPEYCPPAASTTIEAPNLDGGVVPGEIAIVEHFGLGDRLMYARFYCSMADRMPGTDITVICHPLLTRVYEASFAQRRTLSFVPADAVQEQVCFGAQIPAPSLPEWLGILNLADVRGGTSSWIRPSAAALARTRLALQQLGIGSPTAGIVWRDSLRWYQPHRFLPLSALAMPLASRGYNLVALDPLVDDDEIRSFSEECGVRIVTVKDLPLADVDDVAALMVCLDRVVTIDKVFANLGGALGLPTDVFLSTFVDYRWTSGPGRSPFYDSVNCYRQRSYGDWSEPLAQFASSL